MNNSNNTPLPFPPCPLNKIKYSSWCPCNALLKQLIAQSLTFLFGNTSSKKLFIFNNSSVFGFL